MSEDATTKSVSGKTTILAVVIHSWRQDASSMAEVEAALREAYGVEGTEVEVLRPDLPYANWWRCVRATRIVRTLLDEIDDAVDDKKPDRIVLVGNSIGAALARRIFLVAAGFPDNFQPEHELARQRPRAWARKVERIVMIAAFNRGWRISDGLSWRYWLAFNSVGFFGHVIPGLTPTVFDFRLGAPFIAQTRLHWLAYRRSDLLGGQAPHRPMLIQMIGTQDDLVRPFDQVDIAVDGTERAFAPNKLAEVGTDAPAPEEQDYFLLEIPFTTHKSATVLTGDHEARTRRDIFMAALTEDRATLSERAVDPALLADEVDAIDETVHDTVFVIHGIRDDGYWTHRIAERIRRAGQAGGRGSRTAFRSWTPSYGYFAMLPFMLFWVRREKVEWFTDQYVTAFAQYPKSDFHYVGHSNGTYLVARALRDCRAMHFKRVLFAGSVVRSDYPWRKRIKKDRVQQFQNVVAADDKVVAWLPKSVEWCRLFDLGGGGFNGFHDAGSHEAITEFKYVRGGHSAGIAEDFWDQIAAFITRGEPFRNIPSPSGRDLYESGPNPTTDGIARTNLGIPCVLLFGLGFAALGAWLGASLFHGGAPGGWLGLLIAILILRFVITRV